MKNEFFDMREELNEIARVQKMYLDPDAVICPKCEKVHFLPWGKGTNGEHLCPACCSPS